LRFHRPLSFSLLERQVASDADLVWRSVRQCLWHRVLSRDVCRLRRLNFVKRRSFVSQQTLLGLLWSCVVVLFWTVAQVCDARCFDVYC